MRVAVCVCTCERLELLRELLRGIAGLRFHKVEEPEITVVVVDNGERASAKEVCGAVKMPWPTRYVVEPRRGITYTRNRAIVESGAVDFIAFIDDDEIPDSLWLDELLWTQSEFDADVVSGLVLPKYGSEIPDWVKRGRFFDPPIFATGASRNTCACNNVLIRTHVLKRVPRFDDAFAVSGGEDTSFFLQVKKSGYRIVSSQEAVVFESVPRKRANVFWILRREFQTGNGWVFCEAGIDGRLRIRVARFFRACGHVVIGSAKAALGTLRFDRVAVVHALQRVWRGAGMLAALAGHRFLAYRRRRTQSLKIDNAMVQKSVSKPISL